MSRQRVAELCRRLKPVLGRKIDLLWAVYLSETTETSRAETEQTLELLAAEHLGAGYEPDRSPFPPPGRETAGSGEIPVGSVSYAGRDLGPFRLRADRLKEHLLICGRSGSGKTNLAFVLLDQIMRQGVRILALDWKRAYRDLMQVRPDLRVHTIGRDLTPLRFNPLIPPPGCDPQAWSKLIVDVIASAYLGGEGVISLLVSGLDHLYREAGVYENRVERWPTPADLLQWLQQTKLSGRAAMWKASAERILQALSHGEFAASMDTQDNAEVRGLLEANAVLEMDGLSSSSDRSFFSEALTLYLYRYRLAEGPSERLTNLIVLEEAHHLLLEKAAGSRESVLENSIRMIRQYGLGYVFIDQSASLLSKVAFANSYATFALSQKLQADVRAMAGALNLTDEQKEAVRTLPVGSAVVRLADDHPEPFMIRVPQSPVREGEVTDERVRRSVVGATPVRGDNEAREPGTTNSTDSMAIPTADTERAAVPAIPAADKKASGADPDTPIHPPVTEDPHTATREEPQPSPEPFEPDWPSMSREEIRFLADAAERPLSTTVQRYQRLSLSRRKGNAIRQKLTAGGLIEPVRIPTRSGQVVLTDLTEHGATLARRLGLPEPLPRRGGLEHAFWVDRAKRHFEKEGYEVTEERIVENNGRIDLLAEREHERLQIEIETGQSDIDENLTKAAHAGFDGPVLVATNPTAADRCQRAVARLPEPRQAGIRLFSWLDIT